MKTFKQYINSDDYDSKQNQSVNEVLGKERRGNRYKEGQGFTPWIYASNRLTAWRSQLESDLKQLKSQKNQVDYNIERMKEVPKERGLPLTPQELKKIRKMIDASEQRISEFVRKL